MNPLECKRLKRLIRQGKLPRFFLAKGKNGRLERDRYGYLTLRQISTFDYLAWGLGERGTMV